jgi:hypothetical protein
MRLALYGPLAGKKSEAGREPKFSAQPSATAISARRSLASVASILCDSVRIVSHGYWEGSQVVKVRMTATNVKEFRKEDSTLNLALFLSKNLYHLTCWAGTNKQSLKG